PDAAFLVQVADGLRTSLRFVVARARAHRLHVAEIILLLRMLRGIAVHLAAGGVDVVTARVFGQLEELEAALDVGAQGELGLGLVMHRRRGARQVEDRIDRQPDRVEHAALDEREARRSQQARDVAPAPGEQIVEAEDAVPVLDEPSAQMRANEAGATCNENLHEVLSVWSILCLRDWPHVEAGMAASCKTYATEDAGRRVRDSLASLES